MTLGLKMSRTANNCHLDYNMSRTAKSRAAESLRTFSFPEIIIIRNDPVCIHAARLPRIPGSSLAVVTVDSFFQEYDYTYL